MHVYAWGAGTQGQLGNGQLQDSLVPTSVTGLGHQHVQSIVCGGNAAVCITGCGDVFASGDNSFGQLGLGMAVGGTERLVQLDLQVTFAAQDQQPDQAAQQQPMFVAEIAAGGLCISRVAAGGERSAAITQQGGLLAKCGLLVTTPWASWAVANSSLRISRQQCPSSNRLNARP
eukprot:gene4428-4681_t